MWESSRMSCILVSNGWIILTNCLMPSSLMNRTAVLLSFPVSLTAAVTVTSVVPDAPDVADNVAQSPDDGFMVFHALVDSTTSLADHDDESLGT